MSGHRTSSIPRPAGDRSGAERAPAVARPRRDLTTPIPIDKQLVRGRSTRLLVGVVAVIVVVALAAALYVLPVRAWIQQHDDLARRQAEVSTLENANVDLQAEVDRLQTPEGIAEAAREEIGYVGVGEDRVSVLPAPAAPTALPAGWPYDQVRQILEIRTAEATAAAAAATSTTATTATTGSTVTNTTVVP